MIWLVVESRYPTGEQHGKHHPRKKSVSFAIENAPAKSASSDRDRMEALLRQCEEQLPWVMQSLSYLSVHGIMCEDGMVTNWKDLDGQVTNVLFLTVLANARGAEVLRPNVVWSLVLGVFRENLCCVVPERRTISYRHRLDSKKRRSTGAQA